MVRDIAGRGLLFDDVADTLFCFKRGKVEPQCQLRRIDVT